MAAGRRVIETGAALTDRSWLPATVVGVVVLATLGRVAVGSLVGDPVAPVTYAGVAGGTVGGLVVVTAIRRLGLVDDWPAGAVRAFLWTHAAFLAVAGGGYPRAMHALTGSAALYADLPWALVTGLLWSGLAFLVVVAGYLVLRGLGPEEDEAGRWARILVLYLVYGVVLGVTVGLTTRVWYPLFGV